MLTLSLRGLAAPATRVVVRCQQRRCFGVALPRWPSSLPGLAPPPQLAWHRQQRARGLATVDSLRAWFLDGPEAVVSPVGAAASETAAAAASAAADAGSAPVAASAALPPPADEAAATFFVGDTPPALQELLDGASTAVEVASAAVEPSFASLGLLSGFWPSNLQLKLLEVMHVSLDAPWWVCAVVLGVAVRLILVLPNMRMQRLIRVDMPKLEAFRSSTDRIALASESGNIAEVMRLNQRLLEQFPDLVDNLQIRQFLRRIPITIMTNLAALFIIQVASIRAVYRATALPVESLQQGGLLWVTDLTCIDPYFVLPAVITALLMLNVRFYFKSAAAVSGKVLLLKPLAFSLLPTFAFTCLITLPSANLFYFLATGCTAQLIHHVNSSHAGRQFWKSRIGLPPIEEMPPPQSPTNKLVVERMRNDIWPAIKSRDYQTTRLTTGGTGDAPKPKTFRVRGAARNVV